MSRVRFYVKHIEIEESGYLMHLAARCGPKCGLIGALGDGRLVATCAWPIDLYLVVTSDRDESSRPVYRAVEV